VSPSALQRWRQFDDGFGGVDAVHLRYVSEASEESHSGAVAAAEIDARHAGPDAAFSAKSIDRLESADVNLLAHDHSHNWPSGPP